MLKYQKFLSAMQTQGLVQDNRKRVLPNFTDYKVLDAVPLVFTPSGEMIDFKGEYNLDGKPLDLPFKTVFVEMLGNNSPITDDGEGKTTVEGVFIQEHAPHQYALLFLMNHDGRYDVLNLTTDDPNNEAIIQHFLQILSHLLRRLYTEAVGTSSPRTSVKIKIDGKKIFKRINKVIYITPKNARESIQSNDSKVINWENRWRVRGHWRNIPGRLGKDRDGNPQMDFTWVTDHVKGPEDAPLIEKIRVISNH